MLLLLGLRLVLVDGKSLVHVEVPDFFPALSRIESLVLRVTDPAEFRIGRRRLGAIALAYELDHTFRLIDLLPQHLAQVAAFRSENILPNGLVSQKGQGVCDELARTAQLFADGRNENGRARRHGGMIRYRVDSKLTSSEDGVAKRRPEERRFYEKFAQDFLPASEFNWTHVVDETCARLHWICFSVGLLQWTQPRASRESGANQGRRAEA